MRPLNVSASQAKDYYYEKDPCFSDKSNSSWHGNLADKFGIAGDFVKQDNFTSVLSGCNTKGIKLVQDGVNGEHVAATDIPFSAPKSVSVMALHVGDERLIKAHKEAVKSTLNHVENNYIYARRTTHGKTRAFKTSRAIFACFDHSTSRANDPQLHTHSLIMNMTKTDNGYRAVFNERIFKDQRLITVVYRSELAKRVKALGYGIDRLKEGKWEISGVSKDCIDAFSTRTKDIDELENKYAEEGKFSGAAPSKKRNIAVLDSRADKAIIDPEELKKRWENKYSKDKIHTNLEPKAETKTLSLDRTIRMAAKSITEHESTFSRSELMFRSLSFGMGDYTVGQIEGKLSAQNKSGIVLKIADKTDRVGISDGVLTTPEMLSIETEIVKSFADNMSSVESLSDEKRVKKFIEDRFDYFTAGQKEAVRSVMCSRDRFNIIQGDAGTGKTTALKACKEFLKKLDPERIELVGLGFTGKAAKEIESGAGIKSKTLHKFLIKKPSFDTVPDKYKVWLVDESSMVGSRQMKKLMDRAVVESATVFFIGDGKQLQAISAGRMFKDLQEKGFLTVKLDEVLRQTTVTARRDVGLIKSFQDGKDPDGVEKLFSHLDSEKRVTQVPGRDERLRVSAAKYVKGDVNNTLLISPVNEHKTALNNTVRDLLKERGQLSKERSVIFRKPVRLDGVSKYMADSFEPGQKVFVEQAPPGGGVMPGQEAEVIKKNTLRNQLRIRTTGGAEIDINPLRDKTVLTPFEDHESCLAIGDKVVFLKNDTALRVQNGLTGNVSKLDESGNIFIKTSDREVRFNLSDYKYIDHGYSVSTHKSQGQTVDNVIFVTDSGNYNNSVEQLYVAASRAKKGFQIVVDDAKLVKKQLSMSQTKTSVIKALGLRKSSRSK